jgi:hypothetical protein
MFCTKLDSVTENFVPRTANSFPNKSSLALEKSHPVLRRLYAHIALRVRGTRGFVRLVCSTICPELHTLCAMALICPVLNASPR